MGITETQMPKNIRDIINEEKSIFDKDVSITDYNKIQKDAPIENPTYWYRIKDVVCVYIDMIGSTKLSASQRPKTMSKIYRLFSQTVVNIFHEMDAPYIDIKGDGVFALFNSDQCYRAFVSAIHIKTFAENEFLPKIKNIINDNEKNIGAHIGIDQKTLLVRKIGLKMVDRTDRQNEVWAGKAVNMAAKLASMSSGGELYISDRYYNKINSEFVRYSCPCNSKAFLWEEKEINDNKFDFKKIHILKTKWCEKHGEEYSKYILRQDET